MSFIGAPLENPSSSLMWVAEPFTELMAVLGDTCLGVSFHTCMFGSRRKKLTAIWTSVRDLEQLQRFCDGSHDHEAWGLTRDGTFATAQECAYDPTLCAHWAHAIAQYAKRLGYSEPPTTFDDVGPGHLHVRDQANRAILGALPRGNKLPPLLTDFLQKTTVKMQDFLFFQSEKPWCKAS
eukprot:s3525_g6.t1